MPKRLFRAFISFIIFISCNSNNHKQDYLPTAEGRTDTLIKVEKSLDSARFEKLGGLKLLNQEADKKCNLTKGYYSLNKKITDSSDLGFFAQYSADVLMLNAKPMESCSYPIMTAAYVYLNKAAYLDYEGNWISMCTKTPTNYSGEVSVNTFQIKK
jgi:hypothetical protein